MKKTLLLGGVLLLPQIAMSQTPSDLAGTLAIGSPVRGEITTRDRINYNDGSRSVLYAIDLDAGQAVSLQASGALCAKLVVLHAGERVAGPNTVKCEGTSEPATSRLSVMAAEKGRYEVAVSGAGSRAFGPFRLEAKALQVHRGDSPLQAGTEIADFLREGGRSYRLAIRQSGYYVIDMRSDEFDSALELSGNGVSVNDDDGGDNLNARLRVPLEPGTYTLRTKSAIDGSATGMYELSISTGALPAGVRLRNGGELATDGKALTGALTGTPREYQLRIAQPSRIILDLASDDFDTVLELQGNGVTLSNDDGPDGTNSRLSTVLQPGTYQVKARGLGDSASGLFRLSATRQAFDAASFRNGGVIAPGSAITGMLGGEALRYTVEVPHAGRLVVDMTSDDVDSVLELQRDGRSVAEDDDSGGESNARISTDVEPGTYTIIAKGFNDSASGLFELRTRLEQ